MAVESAIDNIGRNMGENSQAFSEWINTQSKSLAMAKADAYSYGSTFSNLLSSFTSSAKETADQTQELMKAAAIIASKTGRTYDDVSNRIRSGMLGSTEAIEDLGVYTNISMIESTNAFKKFAGDKSWAQLDFQVQQQIRLAAILEQTYDRYGDTLADTTQTRHARFIASLNNIKLSLGNAFMSIYNAVLPALNALASQIEFITSKFSAFTQALFGKPADVKGTQKQADAIESVGDAAEKAGKQAKGALAGFDEINKVSGADDGGVAGIVATPNVSEAAEPDTSQIEKFKKAFDFSEIRKSLSSLKTALTPLSENVGAGLKWLWDNVLVPYGSWTINEAAPVFLNLMSGAIGMLNSVISSLKPLGDWLWNSFLKPIASWTGGIITNALDNIAKGLKAISGWIKKNQSVVEVIAVVIGSFAAAWGLVNAAITIWNVVGAIAAGVTTAFGAAVAFLTSPIGLVVIAIGALIAIVVLLVKNWDKVKAAGGKAWDWIKGIWNGAANWMNNKVIKPIGKFFSGLWDGIKAGFVGFINFVIRGINKMIKNFLTPVNLLIKGWNATVGKVTAKIPEIKVAIPEIPKLASGGIISGRSIVEVGEYANARSNPEIISPLDKLKEMIADVAGGDIYLTTSVVLDDGTLVGSAKQKIARGNRLVGKPIMGV